MATRKIYKQVLPQISVEKIFSIKKIAPPLARIKKVRLLPNRLSVFSVANWFKPSIFILFGVAFYCQVRKPAVGSRPVPVHHVGSDLHHVARQQLPGRPALFLIVAPSADGDQKLTARMDVPVVAASGREGDVRHGDVQRRVRRQAGLQGTGLKSCNDSIYRVVTTFI